MFFECFKKCLLGKKDPVEPDKPKEPEKLVSQIIYEEAEKYLGEKEIRGSEHNKIIQGFFKEVLGAEKPDEWAWCAAFVGAVLKRVGLPSTSKDVSLMARAYLEYGKVIEEKNLQKGDIVIFWREKKSSWKGHVAFFDHFDGSKVYVLGGNQGNKVSIAPYPRERVLGYRRPT